jgi:ribonucleotide monophosphatase NagD (HAD superfamily)
LYDGTKDAINKFVELGKKVYLITNNGQTTREEMAEKCKKFGFDLELVSCSL